MSIVNLSIVKLSIPKMSIVKMGIVKNENWYNQSEYSQSEYTQESKQEQGSASVSNLTILNLTTNKDSIKDNIKNTLSQDQIIDLFYNGIGQTKVTKQKRERAKSNIKELTEDGFTSEDIVFAINWTIKNAKEKPYDFALIKDTIGQAMATKKEIEAEEQKSLEKEQNRAKQLEEEKKLAEERERIVTYKESLSPKQRAELRERALDEIKKSGTIRQELIGQPLIEAKENEILRKKLNVDE